MSGEGVGLALQSFGLGKGGGAVGGLGRDEAAASGCVGEGGGVKGGT
jgi:hypothetical protein